MNTRVFERSLSTLVIFNLFFIAPCQFVLANEISKANNSTQNTAPVENSGEIKAQVQMNPSPLQSKIAITKEIMPLKSRLQKKYTATKITFQNNYEHPIEIVSASVSNGTNGQQGYLLVRKRSGAAIAGLLGGGLLVGLFTFGAGLLLGMLASPIVWGVNRSKNKKALRESLPFNNQMPLGIFNPGETVSVSTLVPFGTQAKIEATLRDTKTGELFTISQ